MGQNRKEDASNPSFRWAPQAAIDGVGRSDAGGGRGLRAGLARDAPARTGQPQCRRREAEALHKRVKGRVKIRPKAVTPSMPPNTAVPSGCHISAPAPVAITNGATPSRRPARSSGSAVCGYAPRTPRLRPACYPLLRADAQTRRSESRATARIEPRFGPRRCWISRLTGRATTTRTASCARRVCCGRSRSSRR
jgi:hypothetical protein